MAPQGQPPGRRTGLVVGIVVAVVVLLAGGGTGLYLLSNRSDEQPGGGTAGGGTDAAALAVVDKFTKLNQDQLTQGRTNFAEFEGVVCAQDLATGQERAGSATVRTTPQPNLTITTDHVQVDGDHGTFTMHVSGTDSTNRQHNQDVPLRLVKDSGSWRVCGLYDSAPASGTPSSQPRPSR